MEVFPPKGPRRITWTRTKNPQESAILKKGSAATGVSIPSVGRSVNDITKMLGLLQTKTKNPFRNFKWGLFFFFL